MSEEREKKTDRYSLEDLLQLDDESIQSKIFCLILDENSETEYRIQYVQIKSSKFIRDKEETTMFQIINISDTILYNRSKAENQFLGLINACVSHELRNPLNSIIAQNIEKEYLYKQLK